MSKTKKTAVAAAVVAGAAAALVGAYVGVCQSIRFEPKDMGPLRRESAKAVREAAAKAPETVRPLLERMAAEQVWRARFPGKFPWLPAVSREQKIPLGHVEALTEDALIRFAGNGYPDAAAQARIRGLIAFAEELLPRCAPEDAKTLRERLLDAHFLVNDFDGAVKILEAGLPGRSANWSKAAVAKIRAHQAEERKDDAEALRQFTLFGEAMAAEPDRGEPEYDPTTGIAYCRAWVLAKNARRCATYAGKLGRADEAAGHLARAKELYAKALKETDKDAKSLAALKKEMEEAGL